MIRNLKITCADGRQAGDQANGLTVTGMAPTCEGSIRIVQGVGGVDVAPPLVGVTVTVAVPPNPGGVMVANVGGVEVPAGFGGVAVANGLGGVAVMNGVGGVAVGAGIVS